MSRKIAIAAIGTLSLLVLSAPPPAIADECGSLLAACATDTAPVDPEDALDDPVGTIVDTVDGADDTVPPVVDEVVDVVDDLPGGGIVGPPGGEGPGDHGGGLDPRVAGREGRAPEPVSRTPSSSLGTASTREAARPPVTILGSAASGERRSVPPHGAPGRFGELIEGAVRGLLLLAVLFGVTVGFVLLQGRLDRSDPKLAVAPARAEVVTFG
jgi:hypothetical protein